jgi:hypothetical protein
MWVPLLTGKYRNSGGRADCAEIVPAGICNPPSLHATPAKIFKHLRAETLVAQGLQRCREH